MYEYYFQVINRRSTADGWQKVSLFFVRGCQRPPPGPAPSRVKPKNETALLYRQRQRGSGAAVTSRCATCMATVALVTRNTSACACLLYQSTQNRCRPVGVSSCAWAVDDDGSALPNTKTAAERHPAAADSLSVGKKRV